MTIASSGVGGGGIGVGALFWQATSIKPLSNNETTIQILIIFLISQ
jgi:hypothetical protein